MPDSSSKGRPHGGYRIGIDIGGTFTDFTVLHDDGNVTLWKEDSDPAVPIRPLKAGLQALSSQFGTDLATFLSRTELFVHGTTIATNMLIQRNGPKLGLLCTEGFRDVLYFRDGFKPERFNVHMHHPAPFVERYLRLPVRERMTRDGTAKLALDEASVIEAAARFREAGVAAVAIGFLWSVVNSAHEHRAAEILREHLPGVPVLCSSDVVPEIREWERISATVLSAYILPRIRGYLSELQTLLAGEGYVRGALIMQINGGCASVPEILKRPVNILASGPAAAPAAARFYARSRGIRDIVAIDMGGTSLDVTLVRDGRAALSRDVKVEQQPIGVPAVDVLSIGAGGGSIAWVDNGGALRVGPASAGAVPGPAAYGQGGTEPTVTDANLVLGYLDPAAFLGGRRTLDLDLSRHAVETRVAKPLGIPVEEAAAGIVRIVNANMVSAVRSISVARGIDIRDFTLLVGGGAGGLHGVEIGRELGMKHVLVPREAGTLCAFGMTATEVRYDEMVARYGHSASLDLAAIDEVFGQMEADGAARLAGQGFSREEIRLERWVDARYPGQVHELTIPVPSVDRMTLEALAEVVEHFHKEHESRFTWCRRSMPIEFLHWRVGAIGPERDVSSPPASARRTSGLRPAGRREVFSPQAGARQMLDVYRAADFAAGDVLTGPALIQSDTTTILVGEGDTLTVDADGGLSVSLPQTA